MSEEPSLLEEFRVATENADHRCAVCHKVPDEVRDIVEDSIRRGVGPVSTSNFLRKKGLWRWSEQPIVTHKRHWKP